MEERDTLLELIKAGQITSASNHQQLLKSHEKIHTRIDKHSTRIGRLEIWRAGLVGGLGLLGVVLGGLAIAYKVWKFLPI